MQNHKHWQKQTTHHSPNKKAQVFSNMRFVCSRMDGEERASHFPAWHVVSWISYHSPGDTPHLTRPPFVCSRPRVIWDKATGSSGGEAHVYLSWLLRLLNLMLFQSCMTFPSLEHETQHESITKLVHMMIFSFKALTLFYKCNKNRDRHILVNLLFHRRKKAARELTMAEFSFSPELFI